MIRRFALITLVGLLPFAAIAQTAATTELREGHHYTSIAPADRMVPMPGKIEVVEVFGYGCIHCANFQPLVNAWKKSLGDDVNFIYMPMSNGGVWEAYGRAYYTAEAMGLLEKTHDAMFKAIHVDKRQFKSVADIAAFYADFGADPKVFESTMNSFAVNAKITRAKQYAPRWQVQATPTLVVNGKYRLLATPETGLPGLIATANILIERERKEMQAATAAQ